jgi:hypothetical protein
LSRAETEKCTETVKNLKFLQIETCMDLLDNYSMKKVQHNVRWEGWLSNAIDEWGKKNGQKTFSDSVNYLLACELDRRGYKREFYEPGIYEKRRNKDKPE